MLPRQCDTGETGEQARVIDRMFKPMWLRRQDVTSCDKQPITLNGRKALCLIYVWCASVAATDMCRCSTIELTRMMELATLQARVIGLSVFGSRNQVSDHGVGTVQRSCVPDRTHHALSP